MNFTNFVIFSFNFVSLEIGCEQLVTLLATDLSEMDGGQFALQEKSEQEKFLEFV